VDSCSLLVRVCARAQTLTLVFFFFAGPHAFFFKAESARQRKIQEQELALASGVQLSGLGFRGWELGLGFRLELMF